MNTHNVTFRGLSAFHLAQIVDAAARTLGSSCPEAEIDVLAVVAKHEGRTMPTNEEVRKHAEAFPCDLSINGHKWGLWRVMIEAGLPRLVAATPGYNDSPIFSDGVTCVRPPIGKWEPVTKSGDSIMDIPF